MLKQFDEILLYLRYSGPLRVASYPAVLITFLLSEVRAQEYAEVHILSGQSNMSGRVSTGYTSQSDIDDDILYYYNTDGPASHDESTLGAYTTLQPLSTDYYGPEIAFGRYLYPYTENKLALIKISQGATKLMTHWNPDRTDGLDVQWTTWLAETTTALTELSALGYTPLIKSIIWLQGEGDSESYALSSYSDDYALLLSEMTTHLAQYADVSELTVVTALIQNRSTKNAQVRLAQLDTMNQNDEWYSIETNDLVTFDGTHFDADSVNTIGERVAKMLLPTPELTLTKDETTGSYTLWYTGSLYQSMDLNEDWTKLESQTAPPFTLTTDEATRVFYRSQKAE